MKIGIDVRCLAQSRSTGVEEYTKNLLCEIFEIDQSNEYVLFFNQYKKGSSVDFSWAEKFDNVTIKYCAIPNKLLNISLWLLRFPKLDKLCGNVDIFFMPNSNFVALSHKAKLFLTVHDLSFEHFKHTFSFKRQLWHFFVNPRLLMKSADTIFAISEATKTDVCATYNIPERKVHVALNGSTAIGGVLNRNNMELITVKEKYGLPYHFILYFGTLEPRKNLVKLIESFDIVRRKSAHVQHKLVLAGSTGWRSAEIFQSIESAMYARDIIVLRDVPEEDKEALYALASLFVYPSFFEGFGFPPLEAMKCSVPIIASHNTSLPEVVGRHAIMIDPYRKEEVVRALLSIIDQKGMRKLLVNKKSHNHAQEFTWKEAAKTFIASFS